MEQERAVLGASYTASGSTVPYGEWVRTMTDIERLAIIGNKEYI